jgi:hypothetical protein
MSLAPLIIIDTHPTPQLFEHLCFICPKHDLNNFKTNVSFPFKQIDQLFFFLFFPYSDSKLYIFFVGSEKTSLEAEVNTYASRKENSFVEFSFLFIGFKFFSNGFVKKPLRMTNTFFTYQIELIRRIKF